MDTTDLGEDGLEIGKLYDYDIIILDLMLPDMNGYEVLKSLRAAKVNTPVLILSGLSEPDKKVKGLGYGADDYLTKPFDKAELLARLQAVVRRSKGHSNSIIRTGDVEVNLDTQTVTVGTKTLHLTGKEYGIMELLSLRKGSTLNKDQFLNHLYGGIDEPELKSSTFSSANCAKNWKKPPAARIISKPSGDAVMFCATRMNFPKRSKFFSPLR